MNDLTETENCVQMVDRNKVGAPIIDKGEFSKFYYLAITLFNIQS